MSKRTKSIRSECEMVSRKVEKETCFSSQAKLVWDFEFNLRKATTTRGPDLMLEEGQTKTKRICDMACSQENNLEIKTLEKRTNYR